MFSSVTPVCSSKTPKCKFCERERGIKGDRVEMERREGREGKREGKREKRGEHENINEY